MASLQTSKGCCEKKSARVFRLRSMQGLLRSAPMASHDSVRPAFSELRQKVPVLLHAFPRPGGMVIEPLLAHATSASVDRGHPIKRSRRLSYGCLMIQRPVTNRQPRKREPILVTYEGLPSWEGLWLSSAGLPAEAVSALDVLRDGHAFEPRDSIELQHRKTCPLRQAKSGEPELSI